MKKTSYFGLALVLLMGCSVAAQDRWENYFEGGMRALQRGDLRTAELLLKSSRLKAELEAEAGNPRANEMMLDSMNGISVVLMAQGRPLEAERVIREQLDLLKSMGRGDEDAQKSTALHNLGLVLFEQNKSEDAEVALKKAVGLRRKHDGQPQRNLAISLLSLGGVYFKRGEIQASENAVVEARKILSEISDAKKTPEDKAAVMRSEHNLALILVERKSYVDAEKYYKSAIHAMETLYGPTHGGLALYLSNYAKLLKLLGREAEANSQLARVETIRKAIN